MAATTIRGASRCGWPAAASRKARWWGGRTRSACAPWSGPRTYTIFTRPFSGASANAQTVTFSEHIAPIVYNNCSTCHRPGQVSPFSLLSYDDVRQHGQTIATQTQIRSMPPWKPEPGWVAYRDERRLTTDQIALIQQWVQNGMPQGDPAKAPAAP